MIKFYETLLMLRSQAQGALSGSRRVERSGGAVCSSYTGHQVAVESAEQGHDGEIEEGEASQLGRRGGGQARGRQR